MHTNEKKALLYDDYLRESDRLQRVNSKIKSDFVGNIPPNMQKIIEENNAKISILVRKLEDLFK